MIKNHTFCQKNVQQSELDRVVQEELTQKIRLLLCRKCSEDVLKPVDERIIKDADRWVEAWLLPSLVKRTKKDVKKAMKDLFIDQNKTTKVENTSNLISSEGETIHSSGSSGEELMNDSKEDHILDDEFCHLPRNLEDGDFVIVLIESLKKNELLLCC